MHHAAVDRTLTLHTQQTAAAAAVATATKDTRTRQQKTATGVEGRVGGETVGWGVYCCCGTVICVIKQNHKWGSNSKTSPVKPSQAELSRVGARLALHNCSKKKKRTQQTAEGFKEAEQKDGA